MNPEQQRIAIAEACGWTKLHQPIPSIDNLHGITPNGNKSIYVPVPDYLNDLNAMHEAEKILNEKQAVWYLQKLTQVRFKAGVSGMIGCMIDKTVFATASQRAEAFLRTIGKWKE